MRLFRRSLLLTLSLLLALFIAACGSSPTTSTNSSASNDTTQTGKPADIQNNQAVSDQKAAALKNTAQTQTNAQNTTTNAAQTQGNTQNTAQTQSNTQNTTQTQTNTQQNQAQDMPNGQSNAQQPQQQSNQNQMNGQNPGTNANTLLSTKQVSLNGQMVTVLTTFSGQTLYTYNADMAANSSCTGACAKQWPPLLSNGQAISTAAISGSLTVQTTANGQQVIYNGHPLYTYTGDMGAGQINGQGANNMWQVAAVQLQRQHW